jgi:hypothetical protein
VHVQVGTKGLYIVPDARCGDGHAHSYLVVHFGCSAKLLIQVLCKYAGYMVTHSSATIVVGITLHMLFITDGTNVQVRIT